MNQNNSDSRGAILYQYKGRPVRQYNIVAMRLDEEEFKRLVDAEETTGLSQKKILAYSSTPCDCCKGVEVIAIKKYGKKVSVKRGILSNPSKDMN